MHSGYIPSIFYTYYYNFLSVNIVIIIITRLNRLSLLCATIPFPDRSREEIILVYFFFLFRTTTAYNYYCSSQLIAQYFLDIIYSHTHTLTYSYGNNYGQFSRNQLTIAYLNKKKQHRKKKS